MNKIINGKKYDTETAKLIGGRCVKAGNGSVEDAEFLFQKETGEFFLIMYFGNDFLEYDGCGSWLPSLEFLPYTSKEAKQWVVNNCSADCYEKLFGMVEE